MNISNSIFFILISFILNFTTSFQSPYPLCPDEKCFVSYCYDFEKNRFFAEFGRWATPFHDTFQTLCQEQCNTAIVEPYELNTMKSSENFFKIFDSENLGELKSHKLSGGLFEIDFNSQGDLYVLDIQNSKVYVFDQDLNEKFSFGSYGNKSGQFERASDIFIDEDDKIYITDAFLSLVNVFSSDGQFINAHKLRNQATDVVVIEENICTHTGGAIPADSMTVNCYDKTTGSFIESLLSRSEVVKNIPLGFSNVTYTVIQESGNSMVVLNHPLDASLKIFNDQLETITSFSFENKLFQQPTITKEYSVYKDLPNNFVESMIYGIHVIDKKILIIHYEFKSGNKYLDMYNFDGTRLTDDLINMGKHWPAHSDASGNLYAFRYSEDKSRFSLIKYSLK